MIKKIACFLVMSFCVGLVLYGIYKRNQLVTNHKIGIGKVTKCYVKGGGTTGVPKMYVDYEFNYDGKIINGRSIKSELKTSTCEKYFLHKFFPVVFAVENVNNSNMLIFPDNFQMYDEIFPDSLKWVEQYMTEVY